MHTSASAAPGSDGRRGGTPRACHQYDTSPFRMAGLHLCPVQAPLAVREKLSKKSYKESYRGPGMNRHQVRQPWRSQAFWMTGRVASRYATWGARRGVEYRALAGGRRLPGGPPDAGLLPQDRAQARGSPGQRELAVPAG